ncbi:hypothetical protein [Neobacillus terrae]|uniref:hypothetical protein n=1 Tax=Neobacillus terrae TaxID=3034837 RepID=UPI00140B531E|nr:hypothetical protein [Neobacillus terrae]NHM33885.1 hypothetical protein [Neobacillus terrae]
MDTKFIREISNTTVITGWFFIIIGLIGEFSVWLVIMAWFGSGIGGLIYLLNLFALCFLAIYGRKEDFFVRNILLIISYLVVYPYIFILTRN